MSTHQCTKCGKISSNKKELCATSKEITSLYVCKDCNKQSVSAEGICRPKEVAPSYYCKTCGSSAGDESSLCKPKPIQL